MSPYTCKGKYPGYRMNVYRKDNIKQLFASFVRMPLLAVCAAVLCSSFAIADSFAITDNSTSLIPPSDPKQSITYWKKYRLDNNSKLVQQSQQIFSVLLRAWDQSRLEPGLYVVESEAGAWAASLADGNILLSRQAIETCFSFGRQRGEHLLAFVLAHELAHQRADDLWHQRFFRMIGTQSAESQKKMMAGLDMDIDLITQLEQKEAQADHDGLVLMSSVGFDPYQVINDKDFFTLWVENTSHRNCADHRADSISVDACKQAQARALRSQAQLETVATQSMLYDLGVQEFVAGNYQQAREYFTIYGRDYPGRAIISAIGLTYFAQAQNIQRKLNEMGAGITVNGESSKQLDFYYPMILDAGVNESISKLSPVSKRADTASLIDRLQKQKISLIELSIGQFEKAVRLAPDYKQTYLLLASAHLLANNSYRVRGVLQGQYIKKFGEDAAVDMLLALTMAIEGNTEQAIRALRGQADELKRDADDSPIAENTLRYSVYYNLAALYSAIDKPAETRKVWMELAKLSQKDGDTLLFRLALNRINPNNASLQTKKLQLAPTINGNRLGDAIAVSGDAGKRSDLWIDGDRYQVIIDRNRRYITQDNGKLVSAWMSDSEADSARISDRLKMGDPADRSFKILGIPDRRLNMTSGEYLAYDDYGLAVRISNDQVKGWFLYESR
jgi:hypothetical protein